jgi:hypothetical protein
VSFYGATAEEANNAKFKALADQARGVLFSDPGSSPPASTSRAGSTIPPATK